MSRLEAWLLWISALLVGGSGAALGAMKYLMTPADAYAAVNHPLQPWALALHVLAAPALVFALGSIVSGHVVARLRARIPTGRCTGILSSINVLPMIASGYAIQVCTEPALVRAFVVLHVASGLLFLAGVAAHMAATWTRAREAGQQRAVRRRVAA